MTPTASASNLPASRKTARCPQSYLVSLRRKQKRAPSSKVCRALRPNGSKRALMHSRGDGSDNLLSLVGKLSPARRRSKEPPDRPGLFTIRGRYGRRVGCEMTVGDGRSASGGATISGDAVALPLGRLERWMRDHVDGFRGPLIAERFEGGQSNPTYKLAAASGTYALRRKPLGNLLPSAHAVDRSTESYVRWPIQRYRFHECTRYAKTTLSLAAPFYIME